MEIVIAIIGSSAFSALVGAIVSIISNKINKENRIEKAVSFLMLEQLRCLSREILQHDTIKQETLREFLEVYECYKKLGGNGYADSIHKQVTSMHIEG